jgi:hypothetical protein
VPKSATDEVGWVAAGAREFLTVGGLLPDAFPSYARIFHPAHLDGGEMRWAEVAAANGRRAHAGMQWVALTGSWELYNHVAQPGLWNEPPTVGSLPRIPARHLVKVLERFTTTADACFYGVWDGFTDLDLPTKGTATLTMPGDRRMLLLSGHLADASLNSDQSANLWWPKDRAWCVATDIDLNSTYIGASDACIEAVLGEGSLETWRASPNDRIDGASDTLNPVPPRAT